MLRAAAGQLGMASVAPPPDTTNRPLLKAIASSSGSLANRRPPTGRLRVVLSVAIDSTVGGAPGREMITVRVARSQRIEKMASYRASDPDALAA